MHIKILTQIGHDRFTMKKRKTREGRIKEIIIGIAIVAVIGVCILKIIRDYRAFEGIMTLTLQDVTMFRIYPRVGGPRGIPREFFPNESIVIEFLESIMDFKAYHSTPSSAISRDYTWFVEIATQEGKIIQTRCSISQYTPHIVIVHVGTARYQSKQLLQWYQKYSHLWLEPVESTPHHETTN